MDVLEPWPMATSNLPIFLEKEQQAMQAIDHVISRRSKTEDLFSGHISLVLTNLRLLIIVPVQPQPMCYSLPFHKITTIKDISKSTFGIFTQSHIGVQFSYSSSDGISFLFSTALVKNELLTHSLRVYESKMWRQLQVGAALPSSTGAITPATTQPASTLPASGIAGLIRQQQEEQYRTSQLTHDASKDLEHLMAHAQEVVKIIERYADLLQPSSSPGAGSESESGSTPRIASSEETLDDSIELQAILHSLGIIAPVTKQATGGGSKYHRELASELAEFLSADSRLQRLGGLVTLSTVYCLLNRARGTELVSPDDLLSAAGLLEGMQVGMLVRRYDSGVIVIQSSERGDDEVSRRIVKLCSEPSPGHEKENLIDALAGKLASELAAQLGLSPLLLREHLALAERRGLICRDEAVAGIYYYPNLFQSGFN